MKGRISEAPEDIQKLAYGLWSNPPSYVIDICTRCGQEVYWYLGWLSECGCTKK